MNTDEVKVENGKKKMENWNERNRRCVRRMETRARHAVPVRSVDDMKMLATRRVGAVEFGHGAFHVFAGGIGAGADALDAETEIVRIARAQNGFFEGDQVA